VRVRRNRLRPVLVSEVLPHNLLEEDSALAPTLLQPQQQLRRPGSVAHLQDSDRQGARSRLVQDLSHSPPGLRLRLPRILLDHCFLPAAQASRPHCSLGLRSPVQFLLIRPLRLRAAITILDSDFREV